MSLEKEISPIIIPPISKDEALRMMDDANKDINDATKVINGHHVNFVRPCYNKDFLSFCKEYREIKREVDKTNE